MRTKSAIADFYGSSASGYFKQKAETLGWQQRFISRTCPARLQRAFCERHVGGVPTPHSLVRQCEPARGFDQGVQDGGLCA